LLIEVSDNAHLRKLIINGGFLLNVDYPTKNVKLHRTACLVCNPDSCIGVKPSSKREKKTGEFWYSDNRKEADCKAGEFSKKKDYRYSLCLSCSP
jgi:hypothetical protein